jgi:hypothetical protein
MHLVHPLSQIERVQRELEGEIAEDGAQRSTGGRHKKISISLAVWMIVRRRRDVKSEMIFQVVGHAHRLLGEQGSNPF